MFLYIPRTSMYPSYSIPTLSLSSTKQFHEIMEENVCSCWRSLNYFTFFLEDQDHIYIRAVMEATQPSVAPSPASLSLLPLPLSTPSPPPSPASPSPSPSPLPLPTPSPPPSDNGHSHLLGRLILGILIVLVVVLSYFLYKRVLFPILKRRYRQKGVQSFCSNITFFIKLKKGYACTFVNDYQRQC